MAAWRFLLDEKIDPKVGTYLEKEGLVAEHVRDALGQGAADHDDVLPYARNLDRVVVTSNVSDFGALPDDAHAGLILLYDDMMPAYRVALRSSEWSIRIRTLRRRGREELDAWA